MSKFPEHDKVKNFNENERDILNEFAEFLGNHYELKDLESTKIMNTKECLALFMNIDLKKYELEELEIYQQHG